MKKLFTTLTLALAISAPSFAQQPVTNRAPDRGNNIEANAEDFDKITDSKIYVNSRGQAISVLGLDEEQTKDFTPIFLDYTRSKDALAERRTNLVREYREEMAEDDTAKDEENETADFIENYWEIDIAYMEMKKDFFDRLEDVITARKALDFFAMEDMFNARANRAVVMEMLPTYEILVPVSISYQNELDDYHNWNRVNIDGKVGVDHNFTYDGLNQLLTAAEKMVMTENVNVNNFSARKDAILMKAEKLKKDWTSLNHADHARAAFIETSALLTEIANDTKFNSNSTKFGELDTVARNINPDTKLTDQADTIYQFFNTAETVVNGLVEKANNIK